MVLVVPLDTPLSSARCIWGKYSVQAPVSSVV
jgi:hypothetical protein